jgi:hypothetical protein
MAYVTTDEGSLVIGYGQDPVFDQNILAPEWFDPEQHLGVARVEDGELVIPGNVPKSVTMRQARLALLEAGLLETVNAALANAPEAAQIEWEYAMTIEKDNPLIVGLVETLGLSDEQLDQLFINASQL